MTDSDQQYVCVQTDVSYDFYYETLREKINDTVDKFTHKSSCGLNLSTARIAKNLIKNKQLLSEKSLQDVILENVVDFVYKPRPTAAAFDLNVNFLTSMESLVLTFVKNCNCRFAEMFLSGVKLYRHKYSRKFIDKTREEAMKMVKNDYERLKTLFLQNAPTRFNTPRLDATSAIGGYWREIVAGTKYSSTYLKNIANQMTSLYNLSIDSELQKLIPEELGSLKYFFIKLINTYYENLHPIIWAQILKAMVDNLLTDLPFTTSEIFAFTSKYLLLNSGPFILKLLQMIRPALSPELAAKYNLTKLTYPLLTNDEVQLVLSKAMINRNMYKLAGNFSASVGHVCKVVDAADPQNVLIVKLIKPLAVAQSCVEYSVLRRVFPANSCEQNFVDGILESNGAELNLNNEFANIRRGHELYTTNYDSVYGVDVNAVLTTIQTVDGVVKPDLWYALTMTLAPGIPLNNLIENGKLQVDTKYRAKLHRCLDLLVYKFFVNVIQNGFYHGDLHSGNIFYSYESSQMTLIDFGAVGHINIYSDSDSIKTLLDIVVMSVFYNYEAILDTLTALMNRICVQTKIDTESESYLRVRQELHNYHIANIATQSASQASSNKYREYIFGNDRIATEKSDIVVTTENKSDDSKSIYSYLRRDPRPNETVVENTDAIKTSFDDSDNNTNDIGLVEVLEIIVKFYATSGINIAIKFSEFYEFQKAYALLLGVLHKVHYDGRRVGIAIERAVKDWSNLGQIVHIKTVSHFVSSYANQRRDNSEFVERYAQSIAAHSPKALTKSNIQ